MTNTQIIRNLWQEMRDAINQTYALSSLDKSGDRACLRDYAENVSWSDDLQKLLHTEMANEREHRKGRPMVPGFGVGTAARLVLMTNVVKGSQMLELPRSTAFLVLRKTAVEAEVIGFLIKDQLAEAWVKAIESFDYAELMKAS